MSCRVQETGGLASSSKQRRVITPRHRNLHAVKIYTRVFLQQERAENPGEEVFS